MRKKEMKSLKVLIFVFAIVLFSTLVYARPITEIFVDGLARINDFFAGGYEPYSSAIDFFLFAILFTSIYMIGAKQAFKEIKSPERVIVILLGLTTAFLMILAGFSITLLMPFMNWIIYILLLLFLFWLLGKGDSKLSKSKLWRILIALLLVLLLLALFQGFYNLNTIFKFCELRYFNWIILLLSFLFWLFVLRKAIENIWLRLFVSILLALLIFFLLQKICGSVPLPEASKISAAAPAKTVGLVSGFAGGIGNYFTSLFGNFKTIDFGSYWPGTPEWLSNTPTAPTTQGPLTVVTTPKEGGGGGTVGGGGAPAVKSPFERLTDLVKSKGKSGLVIKDETYYITNENGKEVWKRKRAGYNPSYWFKGDETINPSQDENVQNYLKIQTSPSGGTPPTPSTPPAVTTVPPATPTPPPKAPAPAAPTTPKATPAPTASQFQIIRPNTIKLKDLRISDIFAGSGRRIEQITEKDGNRIITYSDKSVTIPAPPESDVAAVIIRGAKVNEYVQVGKNRYTVKEKDGKYVLEREVTIDPRKLSVGQPFGLYDQTITDPLNDKQLQEDLKSKTPQSKSASPELNRAGLGNDIDDLLGPNWGKILIFVGLIIFLFRYRKKLSQTLKGRFSGKKVTIHDEIDEIVKKKRKLMTKINELKDERNVILESADRKVRHMAEIKEVALLWEKIKEIENAGREYAVGENIELHLIVKLKQLVQVEKEVVEKIDIWKKKLGQRTPGIKYILEELEHVIKGNRDSNRISNGIIYYILICFNADKYEVIIDKELTELLREENMKVLIEDKLKIVIKDEYELKLYNRKENSILEQLSLKIERQIQLLEEMKKRIPIKTGKVVSQEKEEPKSTGGVSIARPGLNIGRGNLRQKKAALDEVFRKLDEISRKPK